MTRLAGTVLDGADAVRAALGSRFGPGGWLDVTDDHVGAPGRQPLTDHAGE